MKNGSLPLLDYPLDKAGLKRAFSDIEIVSLAAAHLKITTYSKFRCLLPEPGTPEAVASLMQGKNGVWVYSCPTSSTVYKKNDKGLKRVLLLGEVYAMVCRNRQWLLSPAQSALWAIRLLIDSGVVLSLKPEIRELPDECIPFAREVWAAWSKLLECKAMRGNPNEPSSFTADFLRDWWGLDAEKAEVAIGWLRQNGYLVKEGIQGRRNLYSTLNPRAVRLIVTEHEEEGVSEDAA